MEKRYPISHYDIMCWTLNQEKPDLCVVIAVSSNPTGLKLERSLTLRETAAKMKGIRWEVFLLRCGPLLTHRVNVIQQPAQSEFCRTGMCTWRQATAADMSVPGR